MVNKMPMQEKSSIVTHDQLRGSALASGLAFLIADLLAIMGSFGVGFFLVNTWDFRIIDFKSFIVQWPYLPGFIVAFAAVRLYPGLNLAPAEEIRRFTLASALGHAGIILSLFIQRLSFDAYGVAFILSCLVSILGLPLGRVIIRWLFKGTRWWGIPVLIFGAGKTGTLVADRLLANPWIGYRPVVILDDNPSLAGSYRGIPVIAGTEYAQSIAIDTGIKTAIVAMPGVERGRLAEIVADQVRHFRYYILVPDFFGMTSTWMTVRDIDGILGLYTAQRLILPWNRVAKRTFDIVLSLFGGLILLPFVALIALLVKIDSRGPVFYGHHRLGRDGVPFKAWKFRSMVVNSGEVLRDLLSNDPVAKSEWESNFKLRKDPRITKMGAFLRKTSLDELPQVLNVLRGEMSLIGPRPIIEEEVAKYGHHYHLFSSVRPGLSGLWQVSGRSETGYDERVSLDIFYIQSWSIWLDLYILLKTVGTVLGGKGAY